MAPGVPWWPPALRFEDYEACADRPNVVVDGSANAGTVLTLSHWPHAPSPPDLRADVSAETALAYLEVASRHGDAEVVTNNHYDQDGLVGVFALVDPVPARQRAEALIDVARAGDFARCRTRQAARTSMAIAAFASAERSPLGPSLFDQDYPTVCAALYHEVLPRVVELVDHPERFGDLWADEDAQLDADLAWIASGAVTIEEVPALDLSVVTLPDGPRSAGGHRFGSMWSERIHPLALHGAIDGLAVLVRQGDWCELRYRYESWVQYVSRPVRPRVDLRALAAELSAAEPDGGPWEFDGVGALTPVLGRADGSASGLGPDQVRVMVERALATGAPAWDPYAGSAPAV
jgi:hypothetical protein